MYVNNIEPEMFLPPGSESFNHNATRTTSSRSRSNNVNNNIVPVYKCSFFPQTIRDWNDLPDSLFSTAEMSDDCVSKFASLVHSRD